MRKFADIAAYLFITSVVILGVVSILGVWNVFSGDVIYKSFETLGLLALVAIIVIIADHFIDPQGKIATDSATAANPANQPSVAVFTNLRKATLSSLIASAALLALLGVLAIWGVFSGQVLNKSVSSIAIIVFSSLIVVITCLERENNPVLYKKSMSGGMIFLIIILVIVFLTILSHSFI